ncbi:MAG: PadR family transcriptional regulator [Gemmatimonadota bacterium]|nr:PadR family transcriptional regulator [Gemmatimonadota bacterium]
MVSELRLLILGLLARQPRTAYALGRSFSAMPATVHSGSPGAIYPAVTALQREGLVERDLGPNGESRGQPYSLTRKGRQVLADWLSQPIEGWDLVKSPGTVLLRLSFVSSKSARQQLRSDLSLAASAALEELQEYQELAGLDLADSSRESLELTASLFRAYVAWARQGIEATTGAA